MKSSLKTCVFTPSYATGLLVATSSWTPAVLPCAWGAKAHGRRCHPGPMFCRSLMVQGLLCALTGRAARLLRGNVGDPLRAIAEVVNARRPQCREYSVLRCF